MAENGERTLRERILRRNPVGQETAFTQDSAALFAPTKRRNCYFRGSTPAAALVASGFTLFPPPQGCLVKRVSCFPAAGASSWRYMLVLPADLGTGGASGGPQQNRPWWPDAPPRTVLENWQHFGLTGEGTMLNSGELATPYIVVNPGNLFMAALTTANVGAFWSCDVEEFIAGDEDL